MIGDLPKTLSVNGVAYDIKTDYRTVLKTIMAFQDDELSSQDKAYVLLVNTYQHPEQIPGEDMQEAYKQAMLFISYERQEPKAKKKNPKVVDWERDEGMLFPAINKVAGFEVRGVEYLHWWTFMGYFQGISHDDTYGFVLSIRQKKAKHKKLEKYEQEFFNANREMVDLNFKTRQDTEDELQKIYMELMQESEEQ